jgi:hypothetical protein
MRLIVWVKAKNSMSCALSMIGTDNAATLKAAVHYPYFCLYSRIWASIVPHIALCKLDRMDEMREQPQACSSHDMA